MDLTIRKAEVGDFLNIRKIAASIWADTYPNEEAGISLDWVIERTSKWLDPARLEASKAKFERVIKDKDHYYRVVIVDNRLVGYVHLSRVNGEQWLNAIYIDRDFHGKGIAQKIMENAFSWFDNSKPIKLGVAKHNLRAQSFYKKYGFKIEKGTDHIFADKVPSINMVKRGEKDEV